MARRSGVGQLPPELRDELSAKLVANGFRDYVALSEWLAEKGHRISKSALHRFGSDLEEEFTSAMQDARRSIELAKAMRASGNADDDGVLLDAASSVLQDQLLRISLALRTVDADPDEAVKLVSQASRALADLGRLKVSYEKWQAEERAKAAAAADAVEKIAKNGGLSPAAVKEIRSRILGIPT
ncbi:MAG: DUF3486 family protein [Nitrosomonadales bacterium]|nr:DUF3486 family protein [Nitrosomonadales bacterium]